MKFQNKACLVAFALVFCAISMRAQNQQNQQNQQDSTGPVNGPILPDSPLPPLTPSDSSGNTPSGRAPYAAARGVNNPYQTYDPSQVEPDTNTLSGAEILGTGSLQHSRNIFDPVLSLSALGLSQATENAGQSVWQGELIPTGSLSFNRLWGRYRFAAVYSGGENIYVNSGPGINESFQSLDVAQEIDWARWRVHLRDDFSASPGAVFGGSGMGGPGLIAEFSSMFGSSLNSIGQGFTPSQTIQTGDAKRYMDTVLGEAEYSYSRRSAFTFAASYGILNFPGPGFISSNSVNAQVGYDHLLDPKNSIAVLANYGDIDYTNTLVSTMEYGAALAFGRKITGRLAFQVAAGPQLIQSSGTSYGTFHVLTPLVSSALTYTRRRGGVSLTFARGLASGSGVFFGTTSDTVTGAAHYQFTRFWTGSVSGGYAYNAGLAPAGVPTINFNTWYIGANIGRQFGHNARANFNYGIQKQDDAALTCPVASCGTTAYQQSVGVTINWHLLPVRQYY